MDNNLNVWNHQAEIISTAVMFAKIDQCPIDVQLSLGRSLTHEIQG